MAASTLPGQYPKQSTCASTKRLPRRQWYVTSVPLPSLHSRQASSPRPSISSSLVMRPATSAPPPGEGVEGGHQLMRVGGAPEDLSERFASFSVSFHLPPPVSDRDEVPVCLFSSTRRTSLGSAWASCLRVRRLAFSCFVGQFQPGVTGRTFPIRVASAGVNTFPCSSPPPQPPTTIAATTAIEQRVMATVTTCDPRTSVSVASCRARVAGRVCGTGRLPHPQWRATGPWSEYVSSYAIAQTGSGRCARR